MKASQLFILIAASIFCTQLSLHAQDKPQPSFSRILKAACVSTAAGIVGGTALIYPEPAAAFVGSAVAGSVAAACSYDLGRYTGYIYDKDSSLRFISGVTTGIGVSLAGTAFHAAKVHQRVIANTTFQAAAIGYIIASNGVARYAYGD